MYTLYCAAGSCSRACHALLQEIGAPFQIKIVEISKGEGQSPEYLALNPRGQVPVLQDGNLTLTEGAAIIQYLCDQNKDKTATLLPTAQPARAQVIQWLSYVNSGLHPMFSILFGAPRAFADVATQTAVKQATYARLAKAYADLEVHLSKQAFLAGAQPTVADILFTVVSSWGGYVQLPFEYGPNVKRVLDAVQAMPSFKAALAQEAEAKAQKEKAAA